MTSIAPDKGKKTLLIVDDDRVQRLVVRNVAMSAGFEVDEAGSSEEAAILLGQRAYNSVIADLSLGTGDGIEVIRRISQSKQNPSMLIVSGQDGRTRDAALRFCRAVHLDAIGELRKPIDLRKLRQMLVACAALQSMRRHRGAALQIDRKALQTAIETGAIRPAYQPKISLQTGEVIGAEALARWTTGSGDVPPADFCEAAHAAGLGRLLTTTILRTACREAALWNRTAPLSVAVNVAPSVLIDLDFPDLVMDVLSSTGLPAERLIIEVVETGPMMQKAEIADVLTRLRIKGVNLAIDDFGTGFSSLESLLNLPFSELKIDLSFVRDCDRDSYAWKIVKASLGLAREFEMRSVAEGIEKEAARRLLLDAGCDLGQGFLFSAAVPADRFLDFATGAKPPPRTRIVARGASWDALPATKDKLG